VETLDGAFQITKHIFAGSTRVTSISENQNDSAFFGGLNRQGYAVASTQFDDTTFVGFLKKQKMRWLGFTYGEVYRTAQDFFAGSASPTARCTGRRRTSSRWGWCRSCSSA
jgi:hypothetical protein